MKTTDWQGLDGLLEREPEADDKTLRILVALTSSALVAVGLVLFLVPTERLVSVPGVVRPDGEVTRLAAAHDETVVRVIVREGDIVQRNQLILSFDTATVADRLRQLTEEMRSREQRVAELEAMGHHLAAQSPTRLEAARGAVAMAMAEVGRERRRLQDSQRVAKAELQTLQRELEEREALAARQAELGTSGILAKQDVIEARLAADKARLNLEQARLKYVGEDALLAAARGRLLVAQTSQTNDTAEIQVRVRDHALRLAQERADLERARTDCTEARRRLDESEVRAPLGGMITKLAVRHAGERVGSGDLLASIAPVSAPPVVVAAVPAEDIGRIRAALPARVRIGALSDRPWDYFGGEVTAVAPDAVAGPDGDARYEVLIRLTEPARLRAVRFGMRASVEIVAGQRTMLERLLGRK
jgi:multidrug resistance efflux pump